MKTPEIRFRRLTPLGLIVAMLLGLLGLQAATGTSAHATTSQLHGVNWADPNDNFVTGNITPVGLSNTDDYATTYAKATPILKGFQALGANTVRMAFNRATVSGSWWNSYTAAFDAANALGMNVVLTPWLQSGVIGDTTSFYAMWDTVINKYAGNSRVYFGIMNEPWGYSNADEDNIAAAWVAHYSQVPRGRIIVPGSWEGNLCVVGADPRLDGTLLSLHDYTLGGETHPTEADWITSFENNVCGYDSRAVLTEFGVPMTTGVNYDGPRDGINDVSFLYALTDTVRKQGMGAILWTGVKSADQTQGPGPCENASCAITSLQGTAPNYTLSITNQSGLDRLQYAWGGSNTGTTTGPVHAVGAGKCLDVPGASQTNGTVTQTWDCTGSGNQTWTHTTSNQLTVYGGAKCLDAAKNQTTPGTPVEIWDCNGGTNQQWTLNTNGTITGTQSGLCLDVTGASTADGAKLELWTCTGQSNQQWTLG
ncbi:ricin-type beta-trefoil lectin domain protein [Kitasatospora sp. NPDC096128]|uniref:ricin-type beta-trefoil lectin domain protein n=1 Tax=Kitasatospora sp. NPDC096128 TaxID=3155547 RepID=UPI0033180E3D